jgi:cell division cycle 20-like protein 1 (cofactor of APC complex)
LQSHDEQNSTPQRQNQYWDKENEGIHLPSCCGFLEEEQLLTPLRSERKISRVPFKVLDAPALQDDFYLNVVDWSSQGLLAVGLGSCVYLWTPQGKVTKLNDVGQTDSITSVNWSKNGHYLSIGAYSGNVQIWDIKKTKPIRIVRAHESRVGSIAWNSKILSTGSRDKSIALTDLRDKKDSFAQLLGHKQEVCGLRWSPDEQQLASGGNDNKLLVWNATNFERPSGRYTSHTAAVKAIAWSPHQHGLLVSGGGTADRCIRSWDTLTNTMVGCVDTGSQVCSLLFSSTADEIVSSHGYSQNYIFVWKHSNMRKLATLSGHTSRVLYLAASNDGETIVTGAGDETLRFWKVFPPAQDNCMKSSVIAPSCKDLR